MQSNESRSGERGFTLVEIIAVLVLLSFIFAWLTPNIYNNYVKAQINATKAQIGALKANLNSYYLDNGTFPTTEQGLKALFEKPTIPPVPDNWNGPYLEEQRPPLDPWNRELKYVSPGTHNPQSFDLYSLGKDNAEGGSGINADLGNW